MSDMKMYMELLAKTQNFETGLSRSGSLVRRFGQGVKAEFSSLTNAASSLQGKLAAIGLSMGGIQILRDSARLDKSLTQIAQTAGETRAVTKGMREDYFRMGKATGQDIENLRDGFNSLVQSGLTLKESQAALEGINFAMAVTGARAETLAGGLGVSAQAFHFDLAQPGMALNLLDKMTVAGRLGNAELENLSDIFARVGVNASSAGMGFEKTLAFIESLSQVERQPERLATLADSTLRLFTNVAYMKNAQKATGVKFFDAKGERRDAINVLEDFKKRYDQLKTDAQRSKFMGKAFGQMDQDTRKGLMTLFGGEYLKQIREFAKQIQMAGGVLKKDLPEAIDNAEDQAGRLKNTLREAADKFAQPINRTLADMIEKGLAPKDQGGLGLTGEQIVGGGLAAALAARYAGKAIGGVAGALLNKGTTVTGVVEGMAWQKMADVTPVFVTNWPADLGGGSTLGTVEKIAEQGAKTAIGVKLLSMLGSAATLAGTAAATVAIPYAMGKYLEGRAETSYGKSGGDNSLDVKSEMTDALAESGIPDMRVFGSLLSGLFRNGNDENRRSNEELARSIRDMQHSINISIAVDPYGRTTAVTDAMNALINVKRGEF